MSKQPDTFAARVEEGEKLFKRVNLMFDDYDFPVVMTVLTHLVAEVIDSHANDERDVFELAAKFMKAVLFDLIEGKGAVEVEVREKDAETCDCPKCTAARRAMH